MKIIIFKEQHELYKNTKICYIYKQIFIFFLFETEYVKDKRYCKVRDHWYYTGQYIGAAHSTCNLKYCVPKNVPVAFHNGSSYDYSFIITELAEEFRKQFTCEGENTEKYNLHSSNRKRSYKN